MRTLQSTLFKDMKRVGINVMQHMRSGKPITFKGTVYAVIKVPKAGLNK